MENLDFFFFLSTLFRCGATLLRRPRPIRITARRRKKTNDNKQESHAHFSRRVQRPLVGTKNSWTSPSGSLVVVVVVVHEFLVPSVWLSMRRTSRILEDTLLTKESTYSDFRRIILTALTRRGRSSIFWLLYLSSLFASFGHRQPTVGGLFTYRQFG